MIDWLKSVQVPLAAAVGICAAFVTAYLWLHAEFVHAGEFIQYQAQIERRILLEKRQQLETEQLRLQVKKEALPRQFTPVDRALLQKYESDIKRVDADLKALQAAKK